MIASGAGADRQSGPVRHAAAYAVDEGADLADKPIASIENPNNFGSCPTIHGQRDAVHVPIADRLGEELGDEAES